MKILVAGLGLIGGSMCMALKRAGHKVWGWNRSKSPLMYALSNGIIDGEAENFKEFDVVFVALPPEAAVKFIDGNIFKSGAIISDICGVKGYVEREVYSRPRAFRYVGCHPMAGKEVSTIKNACADLFDRAGMVITSRKETDADALSVIQSLAKDMGFKLIVRCTAEVHDRKIAYTSQLAHVLSNAYVKDPDLIGCIGFTGGSFQDMTRIAGVEEDVWSSLYLLNAENLTKKIDTLISSLQEIKSAVASGDKSRLEGVLKEGKNLYLSAPQDKAEEGISVIYLK